MLQCQYFTIFLLAGLWLSGCSTSHIRTYTSSQDTQTLTEEEGRRWNEARDFDRRLKNKDVIYKDKVLSAYVQSIAQKLYPELKDSIHIRLIDSPDLNAFALPNGSIYLNIGLLARMENEDQLAAVLAHEVSHFTLQHSLKQRAQADGTVLVGLGFTLLTGIPFSGQFLALGVMSGHSQSYEKEADAEGFRRVLTKGYDVREASEVFRIMKEEVDALDIDRPFLYSSHPKLADRIREMKRLASKVKEKNVEPNFILFEQKTVDLKAVLLDRYLSTQSYKSLILLLEDNKRRALYPDYAGYYLGEAYRLRGDKNDHDRALKTYQQNIQSTPEYAPNYRSLGLMQMKLKQKDKALDNFEHYLKLTPNASDKSYIDDYMNTLRNS